MEWIFYLIVVFSLIDVQSKLNKLINNNNTKNKKNTFILENYIGKKVNVNIDNDDISNSYLFFPESNTIGEIIEYDEQWFLFRYYDESTKKTIDQYLRISDIASIDEIK